MYIERKRKKESTYLARRGRTLLCTCSNNPVHIHLYTSGIEKQDKGGKRGRERETERERERERERGKRERTRKRQRE